MLELVAELDQDRIPYRVLCRSIFDVDPSSFFLALYRCLEALFAFSSAKEVVGALAISHQWADVAAILEAKLGWHPHEDRSLERLFELAVKEELVGIANAIAPGTPIAPSDNNLVRLASARVYGLRNSIVHYRPAQHQVDLGAYDWVTICKHLAVIVLDVYQAVFLEPRLDPLRPLGDECPLTRAAWLSACTSVVARAHDHWSGGQGKIKAG